MKKNFTIMLCISLFALSILSGCNRNNNNSHLGSTSNFAAENINIKIGNAPYQLDGILCLPNGMKSPPVVILVQGSGQSDYNETISVNKPFQDIADGLAKQGIATIRYNKRYYQYPQTAPANITIEDEVLNDVSLAINFTKENESTKKSKIYVLGHSLGGMLSPYIAKTNTDVVGIISMAGTTRRLEDVILDQNIAAVETMSNKTDAEKKELIATVQADVDKVEALKDGDPSVTLFGVPSSYWLSLNKIDTSKISKSLTIPMLILQGKADFQVSPDIDYKAWQDMLSGKSNVTFKLYDNLNHLFIQTNGKKDTTEYSIKGTVDKQVLTDITTWINK